MNGNHVRSKLKIRNRVLAIAVAFLLLSLMVPKMSFADGAADQTKDIATEEVNNEATAAAANEAEPVTNAETVSGTVTDGASGVDGVSVSAFKGNTRLCESDVTESDGEFVLTLDRGSVSAGEPIMLMLNPGDTYAFEVVETTAGATDVEVTLKNGVSTTIKPVDEDTAHHQNFEITTTVAGQISSQTFEGPSFGYSFPVGGQFQMTSKVHMLFHYTNSLNQDVRVEFTPTGKGYYRPYYWGYIIGGSLPGHLMAIGKDYTLESGSDYVVGLAYLNQTTLKVSSADTHHDAFYFVFKKNGVQMHELTQASFDTKMYVGADCTVQQDGTIKILMNDSDTENQFVIEATITPIAKAGYKIAGWTYNGAELKVGDTVKSADNVPMAFEAKYEVDASKAPATGDMNFVWIIALSGIACVSAAGALRFRKNH